MTIREQVARAIAFSDSAITPKGHKELSWPYNWSQSEVADHVVVATAAVTTFLQAAAEQGWHMRPDEATEEMLSRGMNIVPGQDDWTTFVEIYRAMLADPTAQFELDR